jgi:hypothetical protein
MASLSTNQSTEWVAVASTTGSLKVECGLCKSRLSICELTNGRDVEAFTILPCGHAFGYVCVQNLFQRDDSASCPTCGFSAKHSGCGHLAQLNKMEQEVDTKKIKIYEVDPEEFPSQCDACSQQIREALTSAKTTKQGC